MQPTSWKAISLVLIGIILGCGANAMRGAQAQPQPGFPSSSTATVWQQYCEVIDNLPLLNQRVHAAGSQGFELVTAVLSHGNGNDVYLCFKRPAP